MKSYLRQHYVTFVAPELHTSAENHSTWATSQVYVYDESRRSRPEQSTIVQI